MPTSEFPGKNLNALLSNRVVDELGRDLPEAAALRLALIHSIVLLQDNDDPSVTNFCTFLLSEFKPLVSAFTNNKHAYFGDIEVMRGALAEGNRTLFLPMGRLAEALGLPPPEDV